MTGALRAMRAVVFAGRAGAALFAFLVAAVLQAAPAQAQAPQGQQAPQIADEKQAPSPAEAMAKARNTFEYGDYATAAKMLIDLVEKARFEAPALRAEAYRLMGISLFNLGRKGEAYSAFLELLYLEPDTELDPFYVSPGIVALFDRVKKDSSDKLAPIRAQRRAEQDSRRKAAEDDVRARRQRELEEQQKLLFARQTTVEKRVVQREFWVSLLPFGVGQLQNGDRTLGIALATAEIVTAASSAGSVLLIEELRDPSSGRFDSRGYTLARNLSVVKWVSAVLFYGLWAGGAIHAAVHYQPEQALPDRLVQPSSP